MEGSSILKSYHKQVNVKILLLSFSQNLATYMPQKYFSYMVLYMYVTKDCWNMHFGLSSCIATDYLAYVHK